MPGERAVPAPVPMLDPAPGPEPEGAAPSASSKDRAPALFERLEYGKICIRPGGAVVPGSECYPLALSAGFPSAVADLCRPWSLGIGDDVTPGLRHGTVVRGVRASGGAWPVAYRLRRRPEDGDGGRGRQYWLGRYLVPGSPEVDPLTCFHALEAEPLTGLGPGEVERTWGPVGSVIAASSAPDPRLARLLPEALVYVLSGIPAGIRGPLDREEDFFRWASALWHRLPGPLRPAFTAGWGVRPDQTRSLHLSWSCDYPSGVAVFDLATGTWLPPAVTLHAAPSRGSEPSRFETEVLVPGNMYLAEVFRWSGDGPVLETGSMSVSHLDDIAADVAVALAVSEGPEVLSASDPEVAVAFRMPGLRSLDQRRLRNLTAWLRGGPQPEHEQFLSTSDYFLAASRRRVLDVGLEAMAGRGDRRRGETVVWASLEDDPDQTIAPPAAVAERVEFFRSLVRGPVARVLASLLAAIARGQLDDLPTSIRVALAKALDDSLDGPDEIAFHVQILGSSSADLPETYASWAQSCGPRLAVAIAEQRTGSVDGALAVLTELTGSPFVAVVRRAAAGAAPRPADLQHLQALPQQDGERFDGYLAGTWRSADRQVRDGLLPWLARRDGRPWRDPLLALAAGTSAATLDREQVQALINEILDDRVPASLEAPVSAMVLRRWADAREEYAPRPGWQRAVSPWPADVRRILLPFGEEIAPGRPAPEIVEAARQLVLPRYTLEGALRNLETFDRIPASTARLAWSWCRNLLSDQETAAWEDVSHSPGGVVPLCWQLLDGGFVVESEPREEDLRLTAKLARAAAAYVRKSPELERLWATATLGWQVRLLLAAAPRVDLTPRDEQLAELVPHRDWLRRHLADPEIHPGRGAKLRIAARDFHALSRAAKGSEWRPELQRTVLWAAYRDLRAAEQGDLGKALRAYAGAGRQAEIFELSTIYFFAQRDLGEKSAAAQRIGYHVLGPAAEALRDPFLVEDLVLVRDRSLKPPRRPVVERSTGAAAKAFADGEEKRALDIADWAVRLILEIADELCGRDLIEGLEQFLAASQERRRR